MGRNLDSTTFMHGESGYVNYRCRCETCTEGHRLAARTYRAQRRARRVLVDGQFVAPDPVEHGTESAYTNWCCRCTPCCEAHRLHQRSARQRGRSDA